MASRLDPRDRELVAFNKEAREYLANARRIGKRPDAMLEMDLEMLEAVIKAESDPVRVALIRLLWREVADGGGCVCEKGAVPESPAVPWDRTLTDTCEAMRALGWGLHWDAKAFQRKAMKEERSA